MQSTTRNSCNGTVGCVQGLFQTQSTNILAKTTQSSCKTQELMISCTSTLSHSVVPAERKLRGSLMVNRLTVLYMVTSGQNMWSHLVLCAACLGVIRRGANLTNRERNVVALVKEVVILHNAPPSWKSVTPLSLSRFLPPITASLHDLQCGIHVCGCIVHRTVETPCGKVACSVCVSALISNSDLMSFTCPSCNEFHKITDSSYPAASEVVMKVLGALLLTCDMSSCSEVVALKNLKTHVDSGCMQTHSTNIFPTQVDSWPDNIAPTLFHH